MKLSARAILVAAALAAIPVGCAAPDPAPTSSNNPHHGADMDIDQNLFRTVELNSKSPNPASPKDPGPQFRGIVIQAPKQVEFRRGLPATTTGAFAAIPICGLCQFEVPSTPIKAPMRIVAVDRATRDTYAGDIVDPDPNPAVPPPEDPPTEGAPLRGMIATNYFNPNLADCVSLPQRAAVYNVHVEWRGVKSNIVTIELIEAKNSRGF